ncbi:MAG: sodium-dependent transporter, partial [Spirochaetes bacterium]|nr:sodium-dependent transporter [Spirochaetota bacterium]
MAGKSPWAFVGYLGVLSGFLILSFYSIVGGWTIGYIIKSISGDIATIHNSDSAKQLFASFIAHPYQMILYHFLFMLSCILIVIGGIKKGIERWNKIL